MKIHAFTLQLAKEAILFGKYAEAISLLQPLSANGIRDAQFLYAYLHFWDDRLIRIGAINLMTATASWEHSQANYILAVCPELHAGYTFALPKTKTQFDHLKRATDLGSDFALVDLAECYLVGNYVEKDTITARELLISRFDGETDWRSRLISKAHFLLGRMKLLGIGGEVDIDGAILQLSYSASAKDGAYASQAIELLKEMMVKFPEKSIGTILQEVEPRYEKRKYVPMWERYIHHYCARSLVYDLRDASMEAFMDFLFDHYARPQNDRDSFRWDQHATVLFDPSELVRLYTVVFQNCDLLPDRYSVDQIEQGLGMTGCRGWQYWTIGCAMTHKSTSIEDAEACIRAMYSLFEKLFSKAGFGDIGFMWWDIGYGACKFRYTDSESIKYVWTEEEKQRFSQASFDTMVRVLKMPSMSSQKAAIHGLGHWYHPDNVRVLQEYLDKNPDLPAWLKEYAEDAKIGRMT